MKNANENRERRTAKLAIALIVFAALVFAVTFFKLPAWLPALK